MARIRSIKPEFWQDELIASWPPMSRLAYIALWNEADDEGRLRASMPYLRSRLFPYEENLDVFAILMPIIQSGRMVLYEIDGQSYGYIHNFKKHQVINRPSLSRLPALMESSVNPPGALIAGREGKGKEKSPGPGGDELNEGRVTPDPIPLRKASS